MTIQNRRNKAATVAGVTFLATAGVAGAAFADQDGNPFESVELDTGYELAAADSQEGKCGEGKCGEGKCGGESKSDAEGKCGEGKCGESGGKSDAEGKCGEGKCGGDSKDDAEGKCGEGKCGGDSKSDAEGKCGEGKCGG